jgi:N-acetylglucosamine-6-phosphate deacetylase
MTLAPERTGALERIRHLRERGVLVSLGHTDATLEEFVAGVDAGAEMATHLFNAMSPFAHRAPGAIGAALTDDRVTVGLIADGIHAHPASLRLAVRAKGIERVALVSDMMAAAGMPPGPYPLGGQQVMVDGESARLADGTLAGSVLTLDRAVRNAVRWVGVTAAEALAMATAVPARLLGLTDRGRIVTGGIADLVLLDADLRVVTTLVAGQVAYQRKQPESSSPEMSRRS